MQKPSDDLLVAYLDDELDEPQRTVVEGWLARDGAVRDQVARLSEGAALLRAAFDEVLREEVPGRLIAAARGADPRSDETVRQADVVPFRSPRRAAGVAAAGRWWIAIPIAASFFGLMVGGGLGYFGLSSVRGPAGEDKQVAATV